MEVHFGTALIYFEMILSFRSTWDPFGRESPFKACSLTDMVLMSLALCQSQSMNLKKLIEFMEPINPYFLSRYFSSVFESQRSHGFGGDSYLVATHF